MTRPRYKTRFCPGDSETNPVSTWVHPRKIGRSPTPFSGWSAGLNTEATKELRSIFGDQLLEYPKPVSLIRDLVFVATEKDDVVLDFFAGSGTTAQSVIELNEADDGSRRFILAQLPEMTAPGTAAHKAGYRKISDICIERCKRVIQGYGDDPKPIDAGFKVYTLAKSNFPRVDFRPDPNKSEAENVEALKQYIREKEAAFTMQLHPEQLFDEVLLKNGFMLDYELTELPAFNKNKVFRAKDAHKQALVCLDVQSIADETIAELKANHGDEIFICLERALDTTTKWNLKHILGPKLVAF